ncbi:D-glycero-beta-D-manno-heptose 1-phosphate adenylyltransferase [Carbonactinospora thermoautotrophica]|uniref:D-glycero-beta-D-manno-heptose 1-phosphate adenylyltransferase n=1 Tax=Carbonactinospora thermoautotrophica TaxID=1469144 RepID=UPI00226F305D|nr:D-glycero-beta-D-manno-heptose 1-phosphate adenylyltransferase [Carbonactinospora thermoautotrophica]MCX9193312.1 D-glycero-beta-D-manno-heptose 1-phosphate adenylyltransferase [Carbonactinospora thermoautotrophica]
MFDVRTLIDRIPRIEVLIIGDAVLDCWMAGPSHRLCREAPVPVVTVTDRTYAPGGAGNTAANVAALGAPVHLVSVIGDDQDGRLLRDALVDRGVSADGLLTVPGYRTPSKRRVLAGQQMLARLDDGGDEPIPEHAADELIRTVDRLASRCACVLVCDYGTGMLTDGIRDRLVQRRRSWSGPVVVDAHDPARWAALRPTAVTPNYTETRLLLDERGPEDGDERAVFVERHAGRLLDRSGAAMVVCTLDADGAVLLQPGRRIYRTYAKTAPAPGFTTGAGDSFVAAFTLALAAGAHETTALELGTIAAGVVCQQARTSVCRRAELLRAIAPSESGITSEEELAEYVAAYRKAGRRLVFTNGCFDVLHRGHITYLNQAKQLGDVLIVALNSDESVRRLKGPDRPVNPVEDRAVVLAALSCVDHIVVFDEETPAKLLEAVRPDVYVKGGDYTPEMLPETPIVWRLGGEVRILDYVDDRSTTRIIERIRRTAEVPR